MSVFNAAGTPPGNMSIAEQTTAAASWPMSPALNAASTSGRLANAWCNASRARARPTGTSTALCNHTAVEDAPVSCATPERSAWANTAIWATAHTRLRDPFGRDNELRDSAVDIDHNDASLECIQPSRDRRNSLDGWMLIIGGDRAHEHNVATATDKTTDPETPVE